MKTDLATSVRWIATTALVLATGVILAHHMHRRRPRSVSKVVLITIDTLRADRLGCYGYRDRPTSPNLDEWSKDAVLFDRETALAPWTIPSLGSLMAGRYPSEVGVYTNRGGISPDFTTLAELMHEHGFETASFNTHRLLVNRFAGFRRGFDFVYPNQIDIPHNLHKIPFGRIEPALMRWLDRHAGDKFFLWVHDMDPHAPPTEGNSYLKDPRWKGYNGEVRWVDEAFGRISAKLKSLGIWDEALIIFTADHGEAFGEHGIPGHQDVMYDEVLRIPLIIQYPSMVRKGRVKEPVQLVDLFPTICELTGIEPPVGSRGESLVPILEGRANHIKRKYLFHARYHFEDRHHELAVRDREWKLLAKTPDRNPRPSRNQGVRERMRPQWNVESGGTTFELYRLGEDPHERVNLANQQPEVTERMEDALAQWGRSLSSRNHHRSAPPPDRASIETLRALGYVK